MEKRIAIITGATGGIGREFTKLIAAEPVDEIWAIARNEEKLAALKEEFGEKIITLSKDLTSEDDLKSIAKLLEADKPVIAYLVNNAGLAAMDPVRKFKTEVVRKTVEVNCVAFAEIISITLPFMKKGSIALNISSQASFQPVPYISLYGATKVFERSYSRAINAELKGEGITFTAVCPGWVDTELLAEERNGIKIKFPAMITAAAVAQKALRDAKKGKDMSVCTDYVKFMHLFTKLNPQSFSMHNWIKSIKKYI